MVDVLMWAAALFLAIKYGVLKWKTKEAKGWLFVLFLSFYGGFLIYRLGTMKNIMQQLINLCRENGIDISDFVP